MHQLPTVRLIFVCQDAVWDPADNAWVLRDPRLVSALPPGARFPFREDELWVYAQLCDGDGRHDLTIEMRQRRPDGSYRTVGTGQPTTVELTPVNRLVPYPVVFGFRRAPFREEGVYEFRILAMVGERAVVLPGTTAELTMLDRRPTV